MKLSKNKILITGGASGIGLGLTRKFLELGNTVIICGRREAALNSVKEQYPEVITKICDLSVEDQRKALFEWISENHSDLNVLVNNAGIQNWMEITDTSAYQRTQEEININILAPVHLTMMFSKLPSIETIINVTSGLAFVPFSKVPVYCGTKAFMRSFTLSLRHQLKNNVEVIELIPPGLNTDLGGKGKHNGHPEVGEFINSIFHQLEEGSHELTFGSSTERADKNNQVIAGFFHKMNP